MQLGRVRGEVTLEKVVFSYGGDRGETLHGIELVIPPGITLVVECDSGLPRENNLEA